MRPAPGNVAAGRHSETPEVLEAIATASSAICLGNALNTHRPQHAAQLELVLELIVGRISSDFTAPPLLACYQKFMQAMEWTVESSMTTSDGATQPPIRNTTSRS